MKAAKCIALVTMLTAYLIDPVVAQNANTPSEAEQKQAGTTQSKQDQKPETTAQGTGQQKSDAGGPATQQKSDTQPRPWWNQRFGRRARNNADDKKLPLIRVEGNKFVDPQEKTVVFHGVSIADPDKIEKQGHWNKDIFQHVKDLGANLVAHSGPSGSLRERTPQQYFELLDQAVQWCTDLGMYVDIDWHSIGNLKMELFQDPMYDTTQKELRILTSAPWRGTSPATTPWRFTKFSTSQRPTAVNSETSLGANGKRQTRTLFN